jgi:transposase
MLRWCMDLAAFNKAVSKEKAARRYLLGLCWKNHQRYCPRCGMRKLYKLREGRRRCSRCRYTFHDFSGRWINNGGLSCVQWLWLLKLFDLGASTRRIGKEMGVAYRTAFKAVTTIRLAIMAHARDAHGLLAGAVELDEAYFGGRRKGNRGRGAAGKVPVFGILERKGSVSVEVVPDVKASTLLALTTKKVKWGSIVYTDRYRVYDSLMSYGYKHKVINHRVRFAKGKVYINGIEGFWSFAKEHLSKFHGISPQTFPLYIKEMEFRYNHRKQDTFDLLAKYLCDLVPNRD